MNNQIKADKYLLKYETYEDYLDTLVSLKDKCYLKSAAVCRTFAELGYRKMGRTFSREEFYKRREAVYNVIHPQIVAYRIDNFGISPKDRIQKELAIRERPNRLGVLATIIFIRHKIGKKEVEISGYLDYAAKLEEEDWTPFFKGEKLVLPTQKDLAYFNWKKNLIFTNNSKNFTTITHPVGGVVFEHILDRQIVCVNPYTDCGDNTVRTRIFSKIYDHVVLFDHSVRKRE